MEKRTPEEIKEKEDMAKQVIRHHFGISQGNVEYQDSGHTNFVFEAKVPEGEFIIRIARKPEKISDYTKERWVSNRAKEAGVPVAETLQVGNEVIEMPYMLQRKTPGTIASDHPERKKAIRQLGHYAAVINSIRTKDFGCVFDWSPNEDSKINSWKKFLKNELDVASRLAILEENRMLSHANFKKLESYTRKIRKWEFEPVLNHGDLRLKNVIVDDQGEIMAIIDWENASSNIAPVWDLSIALHDLSIDQKQLFLEGYGWPAEEYREWVYAMKTFNILNYTDDIQVFLEKDQQDQLEQYRLRLNGFYDLYSL